MSAVLVRGKASDLPRILAVPGDVPYAYDPHECTPIYDELVAETSKARDKRGRYTKRKKR